MYKIKDIEKMSNYKEANVSYDALMDFKKELM